MANLNRRGFLTGLGVMGLWPLIGRAEAEEIGSAYVPPLDVRVVQGATNHDSSLLTVLAPRSSSLKIEITDDSSESMVFEKTLIDLQYGDFVLWQIFITDLTLGEKYNLTVEDETLNKKYKRTFKCLDWKNQNTKIALLSCSNHRNADPKEVMFKQLFSVKPEVIFFYGDLVYGNSAFDTVLGLIPY
jgi:hypothetical protein